MRCMKQMNQRSGISFLLVTHDAYTASFCDRVLFLQDGNLAKEVKKENTADNFREDIWKTLCGLGGGKDDLFDISRKMLKAGFTNIDCTFYAIYLQRHYSVVLQLFPQTGRL